VVAAPPKGADVKFPDLNMLVAPGGRERAREEWQSLLSEAGLALQRVVPTRGSMCVIEAGVAP
jgi:O-methyltransferase